MSAADFNPCADLIADPTEDRRRALLDRQLERLDQLIDAGMGMVQGLAAQAAGTGPRVVEGDLILAYSRAARAVRMAILLQSHLAAEPDARRDARAALAEQTSTDAPDAEDIAEPEADTLERPERAPREYAERLERDDIYRAVLTRPVSDLVAEIANDLGLSPDWPEDSPPERCDHLPPPIAAAIGGGGPPAEEPVVEGANQGRRLEKSDLDFQPRQGAAWGHERT